MVGFVLRGAGAGLSGRVISISAVCFGLIMAIYLGTAYSPVVTKWRQAAKKPVVQLLPPAGLFLIFASYAWSIDRLTVAGMLIVFGYLFVPLLFVILDARGEPKLSPALTAAILTLWLPLELRLVPLVSIPPERGISMVHLLGLISALYLFLIVRRLEGMGYTYLLARSDWKTAALFFAIFIAFLAVPLAVALDFAASTREMESAWIWPLRALAIFFFTAVPEEILFRGIIHNLIQRSLAGRIGLSLAISSVIFGISHANNNNPPFVRIDLPILRATELPWVYILLATIAGVIYGLTYIKTGKLTAAAVVHGLVDTWWSIFFAPR